MHRVVPFCLALLCASQATARPNSRSYLAFAAGGDILTGDVSGPVILGRSEGVVELGVGFELSRTWLMEATYGFQGRWELPRYEPILLPPPADHLHVYRVTTNALMLRSRFVPGGAREEYFKPEFSAALGFLQVSRLLRNYPAIPPFDTSQLLATAEVGVAGLFVFSRTFMSSIGVRYRITERRDIADDTNFLDGVSILLGFRAFLPSPRDVAEPEDPPPPKPDDH